MASVLYRLTDRIPAGFGLSSHGNGREAAIAHLGHASGGDVTVHGRGCLSFALAPARRERGPRFVLRGGKLRLRLVKHAAGDTVFRPATDRCGIQSLSGLCHWRRGIGGTYGTGKAVIGDPRAKSDPRSTPLCRYWHNGVERGTFGMLVDRYRRRAARLGGDRPGDGLTDGTERSAGFQ